jgi:hypothetical protein
MVYKNADLSGFYDASEVDQFVVERLVEMGGALEGITSTFAPDKNIVCVHTTSLCMSLCVHVMYAQICKNSVIIFFVPRSRRAEYNPRAQKPLQRRTRRCSDALSDSIADPRPRTIAHSPMDSIGARRAGTRVHSHHEEIRYCRIFLTFVLPGMEWNRKFCLILFPWANSLVDLVKEVYRMHLVSRLQPFTPLVKGWRRESEGLAPRDYMHLSQAAEKWRSTVSLSSIFFILNDDPAEISITCLIFVCHKIMLKYLVSYSMSCNSSNESDAFICSKEAQ